MTAGITKQYLVSSLNLCQPLDSDGAVNQLTNPQPLQSLENGMLVLDEYPTSKVQTFETAYQDADRCPVHGCDNSIEMSYHQKCETVQFPDSYEVCKSGLDSSLASYNPLNENEPNLDMTDSINDNSKDIQLLKHCEIKLRRLSATDIDF